MDIAGATAVVTGAGSGIGRELALEFARRGANVAINDVNPEALRETSESVERLGGTTFSEAFDVGSREQMEAFAANVREQFGRVDIVVNNAGVALGRINAEEVTYTDFEWIVKINMWGVIYGSMAFLPMLRERPEASLVNVSSCFGLLAVPGQAPYCATKFAVRGYTDSLRLELMDTNIHVTLVCPSQVRTNIIRHGRHLSEEAKALLVKQFDEEMSNVTAEDAARIIIDGMCRKRDQITIGKAARIYDIASRFLPRSVIRLFTRRELRKAAEAAQSAVAEPLRTA